MNMRRMMGFSVVFGFAAALASASVGCGGSVVAGEGGSGGAGGSGSCPSYSGEVAAILSTYCVTCHGAGGPQSMLPFDTYAGIEAHATAAQDELEAGKMPPPNATAIPSAEKEKLIAWLACGAPEN